MLGVRVFTSIAGLPHLSTRSDQDHSTREHLLHHQDTRRTVTQVVIRREDVEEEKRKRVEIMIKLSFRSILSILLFDRFF